jgi:hypothetical protein
VVVAVVFAAAVVVIIVFYAHLLVHLYHHLLRPQPFFVATASRRLPIRKGLPVGAAPASAAMREPR